MWYQSHLKARDKVGDQTASHQPPSKREETGRSPPLKTKEYRVESRGREKQEIQGITLTPVQFDSMMAGIRRQFDHDLKTLNIPGVVPHGAQAYSKSICPKKRVHNRSRSLIFSGTSKDPEEYLQWENNMEEWLQSSNLSKVEKLAHAVSAFTRTAREWWLRESTQSTYKKPVLDWKDLKARMYKEFVERYQSIPMSLAPTTVSASLLIPELTPKATQVEQQNKRKGATRIQCVVASNPADIRGDKPLETHEGTQTAKLVQGDQEKRPIMSTRTRNVVCLHHAPDCINKKNTNSLGNGEAVSADEEPEHEREETKAADNTLLLEETPTAIKSSLEEIALATNQTVQSLVCKESVAMFSGKESTSPREKEYFVQQQQDVFPEDQPIVMSYIRGSKYQADFRPTASLSICPPFRINLMEDLRLVKGSQNLVYEPGGANYGLKGVNNILDQEVKSLQPSFIFEELDLRSNPFKGGGDGAILERPDMTNIQLSSEEEHPEENKKVTAGLEKLDKGKGFKQGLSEQRETGWAQERNGTRAHMFAAGQGEEATQLRPGPEIKESVKPNKKPFYALCWTWPRKKKRKRQRQPKPKSSRNRLWSKRKQSWAFGKIHETDGSEEESKAREAKPPDGLAKERKQEGPNRGLEVV